jgi:hypothetical protein
MITLLVKNFLNKFLNKKQANNSVLHMATGEVVSLTSYVKLLDYQLLSKEFDQYFYDSNLMKSKSYMYKKINFSYVFYRDYYQMYYTMHQYDELLKEVQDGKNMIVRSGDPYLRRILSIYRKKGYKNVRVYGYYYQKLRSLMAEAIKTTCNMITFIRHPVYLFKERKCAIHTSNNFGPTGKFDYRIGEVVKLLIDDKIPLIFLIRTSHGPLKIIKNYFLREVPCIYTDSIIKFCGFIVRLNPFLGAQKDGRMNELKYSIVFDRLNNKGSGIRLSLAALGFLLEKVNTAVMFNADSSERSILELIAAGDNGIFTIGVQNGIEFNFFQVHKFIKPANNHIDFMAHDKFGVWSEGWKQYFIQNSKVYSEKNLNVSGFYRNNIKNKKPIKSNAKNIREILWLVENLTPVNEILPYIEALIESNFIVNLKVRPQQNDAGDQIAENIIEKLGRGNFRIIDQPIEECIHRFDLALGVYTSALMDSGLQGVPVLVLQTTTWGDVFQLEKNPLVSKVYCKSPEELVNNIDNIPIVQIREFINLYAPNPILSGSNWVKDEVKSCLI